MAEVMKTEIDWESLPDETPETLRRLLMLARAAKYHKGRLPAELQALAATAG